MAARLLVCGLLTIMLGLAAQALADQSFMERAKAATAILYSQDEKGSMRMRCTATAFEKTKTGYLFVSAAHCLGEDDTQHETVAKYKNTPFYVTFDESKIKHFYAAKVIFAGYQHRGDDLAMLEVETTDEWPIVPVGTEKEEHEGAPFLNIASPLGLGLQVFRGSISMMELDRPVLEGDINWKGAIVLQITGVNGGSSGSAIISERQKAIVGFLVGTVGGSTVVAIPATRFTKLRAAVAAKNYRWMKSQQDDEEGDK